MAVTFTFFHDAAMTQEITSGNPYTQILGVIYFGSVSTTTKAQVTANPGVDPITVNVVDAAPGSGIEASSIKLALSSGGLSGATPGAALALSATVNGGAAVPVHVQYTPPLIAANTYTELTFETDDLTESSI